jgi:ATP-dependent RNA helicase CshB
VKHLIFDEADMMFDKDFIIDIKPIAEHMKLARFYLYSASLKPTMKPFIKHYFGSYLLLDTSKIDKPNIQHYAIEVLETTRYESLVLLLKTLNPYLGIVFVSKKDTLSFLEKKLKEDHIECDVMSSSIGARERAQIIKKIKRLDTTWVISSDVLARGLDMDFSHVIHYDLPRPLSLFTHRSGRTGRMKQTGDVITLYSTEDKHDIEKLKVSGIAFKKAFLKAEGMVLKTKQNTHPSKHKKSVVKPNYKKKLKALRKVSS